MSQPYPTRKDINKLSLSDMESKLREFGEELPVIRYWHDDPDPFLSKGAAQKCQCADCDPKGAAKRKLDLTAMYLHRAYFRRWLDGLTLAQVKKELRANKVQLSSWEQRTFTEKQLRDKLAGSIERE